MTEKLSQVKVAVVQASPVLFDREATLEKTCRLVQEAAGPWSRQPGGAGAQTGRRCRRMRSRVPRARKNTVSAHLSVFRRFRVALGSGPENQPHLTASR